MKKILTFIVTTIFATSLWLAVFSCGLLPSRFAAPKVLAQSGEGFGPETFRRGEAGKARFTRNFTVSNTSIPYTLIITHGESNGLSRVKKGTITLNGEQIVNFKKGTGVYALSVHLRAQNELSIFMKGGEAAGFLTVTVEPTRSTLLNSPNDGNFDDSQAGIDAPASVSVDSETHRAYLAERGKDAVIEFDIAGLRVTRMFDNVDSDSVSGNAGTSSVSLNNRERTLVVANPNDFSVPGTPPSNGTVSVINLNNGSLRTLSLDSQGESHPFYVAVNANNNVAAFTSLYGARNRRASFIDLATGSVTVREEEITLLDVTNNPTTNEFIFTGADDVSRPVLLVYSAMAPFRRSRQINTSARAGSAFEKVAVNPATNIAVAVNLKDGAIFVFDIGAGQEIARLPIQAAGSGFGAADVAINPQTNMAVVVTREIAYAYVVDLTNNVMRAEYPLPAGINPTAVGVDTQLNRAIIADTTFDGAGHNGSAIVLQLPERQ